MEKQLFDWDGFDQQDTTAFTFYAVTLKVKIGNFEAGTKFDSASVDYKIGVLELYSDEVTVVGTYNLKLVVEQ